jgi:hypothetical protein
VQKGNGERVHDTPVVQAAIHAGSGQITAHVRDRFAETAYLTRGDIAETAIRRG